MPVLVALASALPQRLLTQDEARRALLPLFSPHLQESESRLKRLFENAEVRTRRIAAPITWLCTAPPFHERNDCYVREGQRLTLAAARRCLRRAGLPAEAVDHVVFVSTTGLAAPSLDARLANALGFRDDVQRTPIWGLGCAGGAAGLARAAEFTRADPDACVLLVALELCSLTFVPEDRTLRNLVASALFGDGCAALLVLGDRAAARMRRRAPRGATTAMRLIGSASRLWPDSLDVMGWEITAEGFRVVMSRDIPDIARTAVRPFLEEFLEEHDRTLDDIDHFALHPGGPRVLQAFADSLGLSAAALAPARTVLRRTGNLSSATCLLILERIAARGLAPRETVLLAALGPGFAAEVGLLEAYGRNGR